MASASNNRVDGDHDHAAAIETSPHREHDIVLSSVQSNDKQAPESDPRDGQEGSPFTEDEDVSVLTERRSGKQPQFMQEIPVRKARATELVTKDDIAEVLAALRHTNDLLQQQGLRTDALEKNQRPRNSNSPPRRHNRPATPPPRRQDTHNRRPALERLQQP
ncbi:hypothetical protein A2U01_0046847, partial [Trifolium medium]|nr:hypothetical protein [Trifolium medium]